MAQSPVRVASGDLAAVLWRLLDASSREDSTAFVTLLDDADGPVAVYAVPYLEPDAVRSELGCDERTHAAVLDAAMSRVRGDLAGRPGTRSVVLAHAFVSGAQPSESERDIIVGGVPSAVGVGSHAGPVLSPRGRPGQPGRRART